MKSNWNKINFQITYSFHQTFWWTTFRQKIVISKLENRLTWKNCTNCVITYHNSLIYKTSRRSTLSHCRWKNDCNEWWKKQCHENKHTINSIFIKMMNAAKRLKKWKNCVKCSLIYKIKKLKYLFSCKWLQIKNYTQNKNFEISKNNWYKCRE